MGGFSGFEGVTEETTDGSSLGGWTGWRLGEFQPPGSSSSLRLEVTLYPMDLLQPNQTKSMASPVSDRSEPGTSWCVSRESRFMNARASDWAAHHICLLAQSGHGALQVAGV